MENKPKFVEWVGGMTIGVIALSVLGFAFAAGMHVFFGLFNDVPPCETGEIAWAIHRDVPDYYLLVCAKPK